MGKGKFVGGTEVSSREKRINVDDLSPPLPNDHLLHGGRDDLDVELWHACAGPLVYVPQVGETVFYFAQGHLEQIKAVTDHQDNTMAVPIYKVPYMILCKVLNVQLKAETETDEVFAHITLLPVAEHDELNSVVDENLPMPPRTCTKTFSKRLTPSDTNTHGGFTIPKRHADEILPPLDMSKGDKPSQNLITKDLHGKEWDFLHIFRGNPRRHLFTSGWSIFVSSKNLVPGDAFVFLRAQNGKLRAGVRRAMKLQSNSSASYMSAQSMQLGILGSVFHAISTGTFFHVFYHPWTCPTEFIVPFHQYMKSAEIDYSVGSRFKMLFEGQNCSKQRFEGTVIGVEDFDPICWPNSKWRNLKVKMDALPNGLSPPERVSHWNIEAVEHVQKKRISPLHPSKKTRMDTSLTMFPGLVKSGLPQVPVYYDPKAQSQVLQDQEKRKAVKNYSDAPKELLMPYLISPPNPGWIQALEHHLNFPLGCAFPFPAGNIAWFALPIGWCPDLHSNQINEDTPGREDIAVITAKSCTCGTQDQRAMELADQDVVPLAPPNGGGKYMLFGVNLFDNPQELPSPQVATSELENHYSVPLTSQSSIAELSKHASGTSCRCLHKNCHSPAQQSRLKGLQCPQAIHLPKGGQ